MKKRLLLVSLSLIMVFSLIGCKSNDKLLSPEDSIEGYFTTLVNFDEDGIKKYLADGLNVDGLSKLDNKTIQNSPHLVKLMQDLKVSIKTRDMSEDEAIYIIEIDSPNLGLLTMEALEYLKDKVANGEAKTNLDEFFSEKIEKGEIERIVTEAEFLLEKSKRGWVIANIVNDDNLYGMHEAIKGKGE